MIKLWSPGAYSNSIKPPDLELLDPCAVNEDSTKGSEICQNGKNRPLRASWGCMSRLSKWFVATKGLFLILQVHRDESLEFALVPLMLYFVPWLNQLVITSISLFLVGFLWVRSCWEARFLWNPLIRLWGDSHLSYCSILIIFYIYSVRTSFKSECWLSCPWTTNNSS